MEIPNPLPPSEITPLKVRPEPALLPTEMVEVSVTGPEKVAAEVALLLVMLVG